MLYGSLYTLLRFMRKILSFILICVFSSACAQENLRSGDTVIGRTDSLLMTGLMSGDRDNASLLIDMDDKRLDTDNDSVSSQNIIGDEGNKVFRPTIFTLWNYRFPFMMNNCWDIHEGFNMQLGMGVTVGFGKNNPFRNGSFCTELSMLYAKKIDDKLTIAGGGTLTRFSMWDNPVLYGSVEGMANYRFNDHVSATVYGSYMFSPLGNGLNNPCRPFIDKCSEIGAEFTYKFNESFSMSIGISEGSMNKSY